MRVLSPAPEVLGALDIESRFKEIRSRIQESGDGEPDAATRAKIDNSLAEIGTEIQTIIERLSFWQFRATLPRDSIL